MLAVLGLAWGLGAAPARGQTATLAWATPVLISNPNYGAANPRLAAGPGGRDVYLVWDQVSDTDASRRRVVYAKYTLGATTPTAATLDGGFLPDVNVAPSGVPQIAWFSYNGAYQPGGVYTTTLVLGEPNAFGPEELELLGTLADDISYGLDSLRERQRNRLLERHIGQAARLQAVTQAMMGILARARSAAELYQEACAVMVDVGGFRLAAVGERQKDSGHKIAFLAVHGADEGYLARAAATWDERPDTREPLGGALRTGDIQVIANENVLQGQGILACDR